MRRRFGCVFLLLILVVSVSATDRSQNSPGTAKSAAHPLADHFALGWMLADTNGDDFADSIDGHIIVPENPSSAENAAAANLAARMAFGTSGLTLPLVIEGSQPHPESQALSATQSGPQIWIGVGSLPPDVREQLSPLMSLLADGEGGVFAAGNSLAILGRDDVGLLAAAETYSARAPFEWDVPGPRIASIAEKLNGTLKSAHVDASLELVGLSYANKDPGIRRAILRSSGKASSEDIRAALSALGTQFGAIHELLLLPEGKAPISLLNPKPLALPALSSESPAGPGHLDLGTLYTIHGLLGGSPKKPVPATTRARLYVPAGLAGVAMANLAARIGLETTGISLPLAEPMEGVSPAEVSSQAVVAGASALRRHIEEEIGETTQEAKDSSASLASEPRLSSLSPGEGELRAVDNAFGKQSALVARGDAAGAAAALEYAAGHLPNLWQVGKQYDSTDEIRYSLHRFFSLRSSAGQAAVALYHLDRWAQEIAQTQQNSPSSNRVASAEATLYVDQADPSLGHFVQQKLEDRLPGAKISVHAGSLHAGLECCESDPPLHYSGPFESFTQAKPTFSEDLAIPWEGTRLLDAVREAASGIKRGDPVELRAEVSEGQREREMLAREIRDILLRAGADPERLGLHVLCACKPGYSWLMEEIAPELTSKLIARIVIEFSPNIDPDHLSAIASKARWIQELYPVDEMLARKFNLPLGSITLEEMPSADGTTYRVLAYASDGRELLTRNYTVHTAERSYSGTFPQYDHVKVDTGWLHLEAGRKVLADRRIETDPEEFWDHYQSVTLPRIFQFLMAQNDGKPKIEYQPLFDTLRLQFHMSEPDYDIGLDKERISSLEALQEDVFYATENFFYMMGNLESTGQFDYMGRILPVVYPSEDGKDGRVHIEFYAKDGPHPLVNLKWKDSAGVEHEKTRDLPALTMGFPRLIAARVRTGADGVEFLTWRLPADYLKDNYEEWRKLESQQLIEHIIFSVEQAQGQIHWLGSMHSAGLYRDSLEYPHLGRLAMEFELPPPPGAHIESRPPVVTVEWSVAPPTTKRPQIRDYAPVPLPQTPGGHFVSWDEPISTKQSAEILAHLTTFPGVNVYWIGRSYLGENIWAADILLPSRSQIRSMAKETTEKPTIIYSGRQHANEVSSTSHILRLAELLVTDPSLRATLKKVNVVIHPITNPDGADLSIDLMHITPENLLHAGYHGSLSADVSTGQWQEDPPYPESRTRRLLWEAWLPDAFLNPHGYPSHEWVQPFSGYTGWVISRTGAETGRTWWIPRGWFTSLSYLRDEDHPHSQEVTDALRDQIARAIEQVPGAAELNRRMNDRYQRYGQHWDPRDFQQPIYKGVRIYMALKGQQPSANSPSFMSRYPDVTWDDGYTEAPDETAHGEYLHLAAAEGLAYDLVHLNYLAAGDIKIKESQKEFMGAVQWKVDRDRPILPKSSGPRK